LAGAPRGQVIDIGADGTAGTIIASSSFGDIRGRSSSIAVGGAAGAESAKRMASRMAEVRIGVTTHSLQPNR
jgi:hypothetical protein